MRFVVAVCLVLSLAVAAAAQESPIVADRPGLADGSSTVGAGTAQLEFGVTHEDGDGSLLTLPTLLRYGLTDAFELRVESGLIGFSSGDNDWAPVAAGFKWRLREGDVPISVLASVQPPSGGSQLGSRQFEGGVRVVSDVELSAGFSLTPNLGVILLEGEGVVGVVAASLERGMGNTVPFIDFEIQSDENDTAMIVDGGVAWIMNPETQLDVSAGINVAGDAESDWFVAAGISRRF